MKRARRPEVEPNAHQVVPYLTALLDDHWRLELEVIEAAEVGDDGGDEVVVGGVIVRVPPGSNGYAVHLIDEDLGRSPGGGPTGGPAPPLLGVPRAVG